MSAVHRDDTSLHHQNMATSRLVGVASAGVNFDPIMAIIHDDLQAPAEQPVGAFEQFQYRATKT